MSKAHMLFLVGVFVVLLITGVFFANASHKQAAPVEDPAMAFRGFVEAARSKNFGKIHVAGETKTASLATAKSLLVQTSDPDPVPNVHRDEALIQAIIGAYVAKEFPPNCTIVSVCQVGDAALLQVTCWPDTSSESSKTVKMVRELGKWCIFADPRAIVRSVATPDGVQ
jgi:hypothetical protein